VKARNWNAIIKPEKFRLVNGTRFLDDYQFGSMVMHHHFCKRCGVRLFGRGFSNEIGGSYVADQLAALDNLPAGELLHADGRHDDWMSTLDETRHL
jgi:hypothetical protein